MKIFHKDINTKIGKLSLFANLKSIVAIDFEQSNYPVRKLKKFENSEFIVDKNNLILQECEKQITEYFDCKRTEFDIPTECFGTHFQEKVWLSLSKIPYGETISYKHQAELIGQSKAIRAVAAANSRNCIPIIIPCHRVIGTNKKLTGFAGGLETKEYLLKLEGIKNYLF